MNSQIERAERLEEENNELKIELLSLEEHLRNINKEYEDFKKETLERNQKIEHFQNLFSCPLAMRSNNYFELTKNIFLIY